jgi:hypothetical protein
MNTVVAGGPDKAMAHPLYGRSLLESLTGWIPNQRFKS